IVDLSEEFSLVTCCDGIGSKIIPLYEKKLFKIISADVVAANLNDLVCTGAKAVGFVDYIAANKLDSNEVFSIVEAIKKELDNCGCKFLGGETSEINELITKGNIDISGFAVGVVKKEEKLDKNNVKENDVVVGLCSSGIHANGFSLVRKLYAQKKLTDKEFETCLAPTCNYYNCVSKLVEKKLVKSCANITGGGIFSNLIRAIPDNLSAELDFEKIPPQSIFQKLKSICGDEFFEVFNAGVGFCMIADEKNLEQIFEISKEFNPFILGKIIIKNKIITQ
ncbi:MAG TPA: AIR synthase-related protein, partial [Candidatus Gastranaerophilaceae bacterium]|nr:AIR synthase-related protein [Candidatus Gastranaerophilaceae bacterium]